MMSSDMICFHKIEEENGYLSNWYPSVFFIDGIQFANVEQFIMYKKALTISGQESGNWFYMKV